MTALRSRLAAIQRHWIIALIALVLFVVALVFGVLIGFLPGIAGLAVFAILVWWAALEIIAWRARRTETVPDSRREAHNAVIAGVAVAVVGFGLMQAVPYGRDRTAPPVTGEPTWYDESTRTLMVRACYQCHSSEVTYPAYANIAPTSWAVQRHIDEARGAVNYSQFATEPGDADETIEVIRDGSMPPAYFTRFGINADAKLTDAEKAQLIAGLERTPGMSESGERGERRVGAERGGD
ncbi:MAG: heme-binding domain-containing protein [Miltoncostaeaceae bacterium]